METTNFKIYPNKKRFFAVGIVSLVFLVFTSYTIFAPSSQFGGHSWSLISVSIVRTFMLLASLMFACLAFNAVKKIIMNKPCIIIDSESITDNTTFLSIGKIGWNDIGRISLLNINSQPMLSLTFNETLKVNPVLSFYYKINKSFGFDYYISQVFLSTKMDDIVNRINLFSPGKINQQDLRKPK